MSTPQAPDRPELSDAALPGTADAAGWRRFHPLSPVLRGGLAMLVIAGIVVANLRDHIINLFFGDRFGGEYGGGDLVDAFDYLAAEGLVVLVLAGILVVLLLIVGLSWVGWRFATYRVGEVDVEVKRGVLFRQHRRAPLERIQSVNLQRPLVARVVGLTKIEIVTGGQDGKVELAYLSHADAKQLRGQIVHRAAVKRGDADPAPGPGPAPEAASDAVTARARDFVDADIDGSAIANQTLVRVPVGRLIGSIVLGWEAVWLVGIVVAVVVGGVLTVPWIIFSILPLAVVFAGILFGKFNKGFNFVLSRGDDAVRTGSGLTSTITESIPFGRIHAVQASQPFLWRPFGWWQVRVTTAGHSVGSAGQNATQNVVLPAGHEDDVLTVIETLMPTAAGAESQRAALRDGLVGDGAGFLGAGPRAGWVLWWGRRRAGMTIADADTSDATLRIRRGALTRSFSIMPVVRAQSIDLHRPFWHRLLGLAALHAHTVLGPVNLKARGLELRAARSQFDALQATILRVQGAEARTLAGPEERS